MTDGYLFIRLIDVPEMVLGFNEWLDPSCRFWSF